jgi:predicted glycoside hydrolase/deacetylase ChbG (UPF0249 family)
VIPTPQRARVIVHADDFGLHPSLNTGIDAAHRDGLVSSASLMPLGPAFSDALRRVQALPSLDLGLHFTLVGVSGLPPTLGAFLADYARGWMPARVVEAHLNSQFDALGGVSVSHIDSHQHLHALPGVMRVVCRFAAERGIPCVRLPLDGPPHARVAPGRRAQAAALAVMARLSRRYIGAYGRRTSDYFSGMAVSGHLTAPTLAAYLENACSGLTEIVCHPGADNSALAQAFDWGYDWQGERAALCSPQARAALADNSVTLTNWGGT